MEDKKYPRIFKKAIKGAVGGTFINGRGEVEEFLLKGDPNTKDIEQITVEVYDGEAEKYFIKHNKNAVVNGYLVEITEGYEMTLDEINAVSDGYLKDLLKQPFMKMKKRVEEFTSPVPVDRLLAFALEADKPFKTVEFLKASLNKFNVRGGVPNVAEIGGVKIGSSS